MASKLKSVAGHGKLLLASLGLLLPIPCAAQARQVSEPTMAAVTFQEVPASKSGITWVHNNAHSEERYIPETVGPGCAFLDYDNDGWMDIYLVNSGPCDFYTPQRPLRNALYKNNRDGT